MDPDHELENLTEELLRTKTRRRSIPRRRLILALIALIAVPPLVRSVMAQQTQPPLLPLAYAYAPSPNCDDRPFGVQVNCIVLHATVEPTTEGTRDIFLNPARRVSAHFIVGRDGQVVQMVPVEKRAWHAGPSTLTGVGSVNDYSVGIEMVNLNDGKDPYTDAQMEAVAGLIRFLRSRYAIPDARIVSHAQIALPPGRKSDPTGFDFEKVRALARLDALPPDPASLLPSTAPP